MRRVSSPEICLRYQSGVSDLSDPYFQSTALRHRIAGRNDQSGTSRIGRWAVILTAYNLMAVFASAIFCVMQGGPNFFLMLSFAWPYSQLWFALGFALFALEIMVVARMLIHVVKYDLLVPTTQVGLSADGVRLLGNFLSRCEKRFLPWNDVSSIKIGSSDFIDLNTDNGSAGSKPIFTAKPKREPCIELRDTKNRVMRLRLSAIRSIEERRVLVDMIKRYARLAADKDDIAQIVQVNRIQDIAFTQLWSNALQSSHPRQANSALSASTLLQEGRFLVQEQFGGGGQGAIYSAQMMDSSGETKLVALKEYVLPDLEHIFDRKRAIEQFEREVYLLTRMEHPSIVRLIDAFVEDHRAYLVMDFVPGQTLKELVRKDGAMRETQVVEIAIKLCDVLEYMHNLEPQVVHLDVTPDNVIINDKGELTLLDFNTSSDGSGLRTKLIAGKQRYMSPEQFRNEISPACDIYALGCTMFLMLTAVEPEPLTKCDVGLYRHGVSNELRQCIAAATELEQEQRLLTVAAVKARLKRLQLLAQPLVAK